MPIKGVSNKGRISLCVWRLTVPVARKYTSRSAAGDLRARPAETRETDKILRQEGYPITKDWTNNDVKCILGRCSKPHHKLQALQQFHEDREKREEFVARWTAAPRGPQGCRPYQSIKEDVGAYNKSLKGTCRYCKKTFWTSVIASRLIAISKLQYSQLWMAVLPRKRSPTSYVFEGSARCNGSGHEGRNHCMTPSHLNMETFKQNARRKGHHRGKMRCCCYRLCIGRQVKADPDGGCCDSVFSGRVCKNFFRH